MLRQCWPVACVDDSDLVDMKLVKQATFLTSMHMIMHKCTCDCVNIMFVSATAEDSLSRELPGTNLESSTTSVGEVYHCECLQPVLASTADLMCVCVRTIMTCRHYFDEA